jgi:1-acyl-sn-glycerol-3-phosphate acyltransferase
MNKEGMQQRSETNKFIDIEKVISSKNPRLLKYMPSFVISWFKRILHEDELNSFLSTQENYSGIDVVHNTLSHFKVCLRIQGLENLERQEKLVIASNHPLGGLDGLALMHSVAQVKPNIIFPVNDILMNVKGLQELFTPINKFGSNPKESLRLLDEVFASDKTVLYFPAGLVSRKVKGQIVDLDWKKTFVTKARQHKRNIIPTYINGFNSNFFYNLANCRKFLGIKTNIEMFFLVNEMYKQKNKQIDIYFGSVVTTIHPNKLTKDEIVAQEIKALSYELPKQHFPTDSLKTIDLSQTSM